MRTACLIVPQLAVQLALQQQTELAGAPLIVGNDLAERRVVIDASADARACGVAPGMPLRRASSLCPIATVVPLDTHLLGGAFATLRELLERFSPVVQAEPPETFYLDVGGVELRLLGRDGPPGEQALLAALLAEVAAQTGLRARAGSGEGTFVARIAALAAPAGGVCVVPLGAERATLGSAPIEALPCSEEMARRLRLYGLHSLAAFVALPFGPVQAQFGNEGARLWRLAACLDAAGPIAAPRPPALSETLDLPAPTSEVSVLLRAAGLLLRRLFRRREAGNRLARRLGVAVELESGATWERMITFRAATADPVRALAALRPRLETLTLPAAATAMACTLHDLCGERALQGSFFVGKARQLAQLDEEIRQLRSRLGTIPILRLIEVEPWSRIPERRRALAEYVL